MEGTLKRRIGRPKLTGPEAESNPLNALTQEERRTVFLETAARLFEEKGYANTSVGDITRELGFTKGVFYYYWKNKNELIQEIHNRALEILNTRLDAVIDEENSPALRVEAAIRNHIEGVLQSRSVIVVLLGNFDFKDEAVEGRRAYAQRFQKIVEEGIAAGVVRELDPKILTYSILGLCNSVARWYEPGGRLSSEEVCHILASFATEGWHIKESQRL